MVIGRYSSDSDRLVRRRSACIDQQVHDDMLECNIIDRRREAAFHRILDPSLFLRRQEAYCRCDRRPHVGRASALPVERSSPPALLDLGLVRASQSRRERALIQSDAIPGERQHGLGDSRRSKHARLGSLESLGGKGSIALMLSGELRIGEDRRQDVVEFVNDRRQRQAERGEACRTLELRVKIAKRIGSLG